MINPERDQKQVKPHMSWCLINAQGPGSKRIQIAHLAFCPITGNIKPKGAEPISKETACNERSEARFIIGNKTWELRVC